eukprot:CAMPEP_0168564910 /NCGR_PEP_ID=MMETSP0413-20121227/13517_1 /TAXON_ID=136452 /ORGANISM="Filamoeba nolandi, Strain NC-AS-23-1" /LENGTH=125 /DNA_ID=CAMNT_0008596653 /DNA_START=68 /DNA_END=445 /DNA_ORIENTATION=-
MESATRSTATPMDWNDPQLIEQKLQEVLKQHKLRTNNPFNRAGRKKVQSICKPNFPMHLRKRASTSRRLSKSPTAGKRINDIRESVILKSALNDMNLTTWSFEQDSEEPESEDNNNNTDNNNMND